MPFVLFDGTCERAMTFYRSCFDGDLEMTYVRETPMREGMPPALHDRVIYAHLAAGAIELSATDWLHQTRAPRVGNTVAVYLSGGDEEELRTFFDRLAVEADPELLDELHELPFGLYGHLQDRFGVHWFFRGEPASAS